MKTCTKCGETKSFSEYGKQAKGLFGLRGRCNSCRREDWKGYYSRTYVPVARKPRPKKPLIDRLVARFEIRENGCWEWVGATNNMGYGFINKGERGKTSLAHRVSYTLAVGEIPEGLTLDHLCYNTICVNPDHLEPVTMAENHRRRRKVVMSP